MVLRSVMPLRKGYKIALQYPQHQHEIYSILKLYTKLDIGSSGGGRLYLCLYVSNGDVHFLEDTGTKLAE